MSTGGGGDEGVIARAKVIVDGDLSAYDSAMELLPAKAKKEIAKAMKVIEAEMKAVDAQIKLSAGNPAQIKQLTDYNARLVESMDAVKLGAVKQAASMGVMKTATTNVGKGISNAGYKMQVFAQTMDDLQYVPTMGLRPILNNLIQISPVLGIVGLLVAQLVDHWDELEKAFGSSSTKTQAQKMEALAKVVRKTGEEMQKLNNYTRQKAALDSQSTLQSKSQKESASRFEEAVGEAGTEAMVKGLVETFREQYKKKDPKIAQLEQLNQEEEFFARGKKETKDQKIERENRARARRDEIERRLQEVARAHLARGAVDPNTARSIREAVEKNPGAFGINTGKDLKRASPEAIQKEKDDAIRGATEDAELKRSDRAIEDAKEALRRAIEDDPFNKGEIARAELALKEAIEHEARIFDASTKRRSEIIAGMTREEKKDAEIKEKSRVEEHDDKARDLKRQHEDEVRDRARSAMGGMDKQFRMGILSDIALGRNVDQKRVSGQVEGSLRQTGNYTEEQIRAMTPEIVKELLKGVRGDVAERQGAEGVSTKEAAKREAAKTYADSMQKVGGGFTGLTDFYQKLQASQDQKDPYQMAIANSTRETAKSNEMIYKAIVGGQKVGAGVGLAGPP